MTTAWLLMAVPLVLRWLLSCFVGDQFLGYGVELVCVVLVTAGILVGTLHLTGVM